MHRRGEPLTAPGSVVALSCQVLRTHVHVSTGIARCHASHDFGICCHAAKPQAAHSLRVPSPPPPVSGVHGTAYTQPAVPGGSVVHPSREPRMAGRRVGICCLAAPHEASRAPINTNMGAIGAWHLRAGASAGCGSLRMFTTRADADQYPNRRPDRLPPPPARPPPSRRPPRSPLRLSLPPSSVHRMGGAVAPVASPPPPFHCGRGRQLDVEDFDDIKSGFRVVLKLTPDNPYIANEVGACVGARRSARRAPRARPRSNSRPLACRPSSPQPKPNQVPGPKP